jgi:hypothetical protein
MAVDGAAPRFPMGEDEVSRVNELRVDLKHVWHSHLKLERQHEQHVGAAALNTEKMWERVSKLEHSKTFVLGGAGLFMLLSGVLAWALSEAAYSKMKAIVDAQKVEDRKYLESITQSFQAHVNRLEEIEAERPKHQAPDEHVRKRR